MEMVQDQVAPHRVVGPIWRTVRARLGDFYRRNVRRDVPILTFHRIRQDDGIDLATLGQVLDYVASDYDVLTLGELAELLRRRGRMNRRRIVLTFDDATRDQFELAVPELDRRGLRATFGVIGCTLFERAVPPFHWYLYLLETARKPSVDFEFPPYFDRQTLLLDVPGRLALAHPTSPLRRVIQSSDYRIGTQIVAALGEALAVPPPKADELYVTPAEVRSLLSRGHEAAAHSLRHQGVYEPNKKLWLEDLRADYALMKEAFGIERPSYIYPFGKERRPEVHAKVRKTGFACAATSEWGTNRMGADPFALRRIGIGSGARVPLATIY